MWILLNTAFIISVFGKACIVRAQFTVANEFALKSLLLTADGMNTVRPESTTLIQLAFNLLSINSLDLKNEQLSVSGWWSMKWNDNRLSWLGTRYISIPVIQFYSEDIWTPSLVVDNSVNDLSAIDETSIPLRIRRDGQVTWNPPGILLTSCAMDISHFPFDIQTCSIQVTSFGYTIQELNISVHGSGIETKYFTENGEWELLEKSSLRSEFDEDGYTYAQVIFTLRLRRLAVYYGFNTLLPVLVTSLLIPLVFLLPHDSGEKVGYCLTTLLAYIVILTIVSDGLPTTAKEQSLLSVYIAFELGMSGLSVVLSIHSLSIYHRETSKPIPHWQSQLVRIASKLMFRHCNGIYKNRTIKPITENTDGNTEKRNDVVDGLRYRNSATSVSDVRCTSFTWCQVAQVYDTLLLYFYLTFGLIISIVFLIVLASNQF